MQDKIKELTEIVQEIGKLFDELVTLLSKLTLLILAVKTVIDILRGG